MSPSGHEVDQPLHRKRHNRWGKCNRMSRFVGSRVRCGPRYVRALKSIRTDNCVYCSALEVRKSGYMFIPERHPITWHLAPLGKAADITIAPVVRMRGRPQTTEFVPGISATPSRKPCPRGRWKSPIAVRSIPRARGQDTVTPGARTNRNLRGSITSDRAHLLADMRETACPGPFGSSDAHLCHRCQQCRNKHKACHQCAAEAYQQQRAHRCRAWMS